MPIAEGGKVFADEFDYAVGQMDNPIPRITVTPKPMIYETPHESGTAIGMLSRTEAEGQQLPQLDYNKMPQSSNVIDMRDVPYIEPTRWEELKGVWDSGLFAYPGRSYGSYDADIEKSTAKIKEDVAINSVYKEIDRREGWFQGIEDQTLESEQTGPMPPANISREYNDLVNKRIVPLSKPENSSVITPNAPVAPITEGNIDLYNRPKVSTPEGTATVRSLGINIDGQETLIPTVAHDGSKILSNEEAIQQYKDTGKHLGIFDTQDNADKYAQQLHLDQEQMYSSPFEAAAHRTVKSVLKENKPARDLPIANAVTRLGLGLVDMAKMPGKVFKGEIDIDSPEGRKAAADWAASMAMTMVLAPAPIAAKVVDGTLGSIAGVSSKTANKEMLQVAQVLDRKGYSNNEIWQTSGWYKGSDGQWRHEIPNADKAKFIEPETIKGYTDGKKKGTYETYDTGVRKDTTLGEVFEYPELYKAYPELKNMKVYWKTDSPKAFGEYDPTGQAIGINLDLIKKKGADVNDTVIHEVQHAIQAKEGYTYGVTEEGIRNYLREATRIAIEEGDNALVNSLHSLRQKYVESRKLELNAELYKRSPAEREARLVEQRSKWTQEGREYESPSFTRRRMDERDNTSEFRSDMFPDTSISPL